MKSEDPAFPVVTLIKDKEGLKNHGGEFVHITFGKDLRTALAFIPPADSPAAKEKIGDAVSVCCSETCRDTLKGALDEARQIGGFRVREILKNSERN